MFFRWYLVKVMKAATTVLGVNNIPPATVSRKGKCVTGDAWSVKSVEDLLTYVNDLECIFQAGIGLTRVPLGSMEGTLLLLANSPATGIVTPPFYQGDYSYMTSCKVDGTLKDFMFSQLRLAGRKVGVSQNSISQYPQPLAPGENAFDGYLGDALVMDFTVDTRKICPVNFSGGKFDDYKEATFDPFSFSLPPVSSYVDTGVIVGRDFETNKVIMLNKAMAWDEQNNQFSTSLFYAVQMDDDRGVPVGADLSYVEVRSDTTWKRTIIPPVSSVMNSFTTTASHFALPILSSFLGYFN